MVLVLSLVMFLLSQTTVVVPDVTLGTVKQAETKLADAGLKLGAVREVNTGGQFKDGQVVGQNPGPGVRVRINYEVQITVSKGPK